MAKEKETVVDEESTEKTAEETVETKEDEITVEDQLKNLHSQGRLPVYPFLSYAVMKTGILSRFVYPVLLYAEYTGKAMQIGWESL